MSVIRKCPQKNEWRVIVGVIPTISLSQMSRAKLALSYAMARTERAAKAIKFT